MPRATPAVTDHSVVPGVRAGCAAAGAGAAASIPATTAQYNRRVTVFQPLTSAADLDAALARSRTTPIILFKHSQTCGISHMARASLVDGAVPAPVLEVVVQRDRPLSDAIASRFGIRHESPQVFVIADGAVIWHSSHSGVSGSRVTAAWQQAAATLTPAPAR